MTLTPNHREFDGNPPRHSEPFCTQVCALAREELEKEADLVGLLLFQNEMKAEAPEAIRQLSLRCDGKAIDVWDVGRVLCHVC